MKGSRKIWALIAAIMIFQLLTGCGSQRKVVNEKEYTSQDGTYSIKADENYIIRDAEVDSWMALEMPDGMDSMLITQLLPDSRSINMGSWSSLEEIKEAKEEVSQLYDRKEIAKPENTAFRSIEAYTYKGKGHTGRLCVVYGETDYAYYMLEFFNSGTKIHNDDYYKDICTSFRENVQAIEEKKTSIAEVQDTVRWFNASNAMLIELNGYDYRLYGGLYPNKLNQETIRKLLSESCGVTDRASADEDLNLFLREGERAGFVELMEYFSEAGLYEIEKDERVSFLLDNFEVSKEEAENYARWYNKYEEDYEDAVSAWDYSRALSRIANFYLAGYYTLEEAFDASLDIAERIQASFDSWDDYMESYFTGYEHWGNGNSEDRREIYHNLQKAEDNPYSIDFQIKLEKSW